MSILTFLGLKGESGRTSSAETDAVRKIVSELDQLDDERARFIAAFGYILSRVANADLHISPGEVEAMEKIIMAQGQLPAEQASVVVTMAKMRNELFGGTDNFLVTREFARITTREQKLALLDCLFAVSAATDDISVVENNEIRQIASELGLEHPDFIRVRLAWKDRLAVLKDTPVPDAGSAKNPNGE
jgi:uncharacterized tellurite resistance protein B-like protein